MASVEYIDHMGTDLTVVNAARVSFDKHSDALTKKDEGLIRFLALGMQNSDWEKYLDDVAQFGDTLTREEMEDQLLYWKRQPQHWAPFTHPHISMRITTSIFVARQLVKHQIGFAWSEVSRRYVDDAPVFEPIGKWRRRAANVKQGSSDEETRYPNIPISDVDGKLFYADYEDVQDGLARAYVMAVDPEQEFQVAPEQARMTLPLTLQTSWIWTGSLAAWARVLTQRLDSHAQLETRLVAREIAPIVQRLFPVSYRALVGNLEDFA